MSILETMWVLDDLGVAHPARSLEEWATAFERDRHVAEVTVGAVRVSTVFLGIDHGWPGDPILFETMIFGGGDIDQQQWRCGTATGASGSRPTRRDRQRAAHPDHRGHRPDAPAARVRREVLDPL